ncbi:hypothetical protein TNCV_2456851 [Trichonephila clavipes]|nr:hypothetical protein TNCV_2456851 [Trichonephila clavipes]
MRHLNFKDPPALLPKAPMAWIQAKSNCGASPDEMILKYRKIERNGDVFDDSFAPTSKHALLVNIQTLFFGWWGITVISS